MSIENVVISIDIGGTKTGIGIFMPGKGLLGDLVLPTQPEAGCKALIERIYGNAHALLDELGISFERVMGIGMLSPGPLDLVNGTIVHAPMLGWREIPLVKIAQDIFKLPVSLQGDTAGSALGEYAYGCGGEKPNSLIYITVSTGVGSGIILDGKIYNGAFDAAGELGHLKISDGGADCPCGGRGCLETVASGTGIARLALERTGRALSAKDVFELAKVGETAFAEYAGIIKDAGSALGIGVATLIQLFDPNIVILGGSVSNNYCMLEPHIINVLSQRVQNYASRKTAVRKTALPNGHNALLGAGEFFIKSNHL